MARVTVEDCIDKVKNRFDLVLLAALRSREISSGSPILVDRDNDKNPVVALREIAEGVVKSSDLRESLIRSMQSHMEVDEPEDDDITLLIAGRRARAESEELTTDAIDKAAAEISAESDRTEEAASGKDA